MYQFRGLQGGLIRSRVSLSLLFHLPVSAFVGTDATETPCGLQVGNVLLYGIARLYSKTLHHFHLRYCRVPLNNLKQALGCFQTTFSDHLF